MPQKRGQLMLTTTTLVHSQQNYEISNSNLRDLIYSLYMECCEMQKEYMAGKEIN